MAASGRTQLTAAKANLTRGIVARLNGVFECELAMHNRTFVGNPRVIERIRLAFPGDSPAPPASAPGPVQNQAAAKLTRDRVRRELAATLAEELMIDSAEIRDSSGFLELGLDSILAVTWIRRLSAQFGIELPATAVYAYPSVGALVDRVVELTRLSASEPLPAPEPVQTPAPVRIAAPADRRGRGPVAIVGASCRFPQSPDLDTFWENIRSGRDCIEEVPADRWDTARHFDPDPLAPGKSYSKWMGNIGDITLFDPLFFNITPREAELMDPQQRLFLEHAWHAIEDAALDPSRLAGTQCGVFVASGPSGYADLIADRNAYSLIGRSGSILGARIAYHLDLRGPCLSIDTACSSSLVAIAEACNSLLLGDSDTAIAGGVCVLIGPSMHVDTSKVSMLSKNGRCYSFDHRANGFVPGEGIGVLLLKRLEDAERDGDAIRAVIRAWGVNQDGRTNGITAPNPQAQSRLIRDVYERSGIDAASIGLIEAHGTGTPLGDPIEIEGLAGAFRGSAGASARCAVGSVKSNVGHTLAAAGVAGAIKAMLALGRREIPPTINFEAPNENLALAGTPFYISNELRAWPDPARGPRRAAVSSFGFSGTNAHLVLEEYPPAADIPRGRIAGPPSLVCALSAVTEDQLAELSGSLANYVSARPELDLEAFAWTLQVGRMAFPCRAAFVFKGRDQLLRGLSERASKPRTASPDLPEPAELWAQGANVDWAALNDSRKPRRIRLPGYPFARGRYWVSPPVPEVRPQPNPPRLHPLIDRNVSTFGSLRFTRRFSGDEPYLTYSQLGADRLLLGLFYPEMARAAAECAGERRVRGVKNLVWGRPAAINGKPRDLTVILSSEEDGFLYRIHADGEDGTPCHLGELILDGDEEFRPEGLDIDRARHLLGSRGVYRDGAELLARLDAPPALHACGCDRNDMYIDPLRLDAIWKLLPRPGRDDVPFPWSLRSAIHNGPLPDELFVHIRAPQLEQGACGEIDVALYDANGVVRLALDGLVTASLGELAEISLDEDFSP
jgi:3-oxoacyl-(acyl-carrier-protein) synthase/acyl carrier protein